MKWMMAILTAMACGPASARWLQPYYFPENPVPGQPVVLVVTTLCEHAINPVPPVELNRVGNRTEITLTGFSVSPVCAYARAETRIDIPPMSSGENEVVIRAKWALPPTQNFDVETIANMVINVGGASYPIPSLGGLGLVVLLSLVLMFAVGRIAVRDRAVP